jgi:two-component system, cell cycle response regulator
MSTEVKNKKLSEWIEQHRGLFELFLDAFCIVNSESQVVEFNEAFMELTGESYRKVLKIGKFAKLVETELGDEQCPATQIVRSGQALRLDELNGATKAYPSAKLILGGVPLMSTDNEVIGALLTVRNVSAESELQKKYDERKKESIIDGLTQLYNKSYSEAMLHRLVKTAIRAGNWISVMMCDIDHFKKVNDTYGHQAGDHVLANVAQILKGVSRDTDLVGRFGGEEFMCILTGTDLEGAKIFAERFRARVESTVVSFDSKKIPVTVSLGTCSVKGVWKDGIDANSLVKQIVGHADTALYFAKANGRNRACQYENLPKPSEKSEDVSDKPIKKKAA